MKKIILLVLATLLLLTGAAVAFGDPKKTLEKLGVSDKTTKETIANIQETSLSPLEKSLQNIAPLTPVPADQLGELNPAKVASSGLNVQKSDGPSKLGHAVDRTKYQGVIYKASDNSFRMLFGKLSDESVGIVKLEDSFELISEGTTQVSLRKLTPATINLETIKIIRWANLPDDNQVVKAIAEYRKQNPSS